MLIVDSQIHIWQNGKMSAHHRQIPTYSIDDALAEMAQAGVLYTVAVGGFELPCLWMNFRVAFPS